ncbi:hypothetical protein CRI93_14815 [Longimonas halophila]|uniref:Protein argonaute n=1 Tax=Longimonas halophila TaxID=1469170 RepID=A0A2H3NHS8_9BACT|nr:SIR2 family protein [Longimonas halophila]PEN04707.1 hypothetical protein CRI93_14815 [Longimonas halophila]
MGESDYTLPLDAFIRSVGVNKQSPHAFFLGAGASISSGIQSAWMCIWEWKREIFLSQNPELRAQFRELSQQSVRKRIQRWLETEGIIPFDDRDEYGYYAEECYPIPKNRRHYFQNLVSSASPGLGYQLLCLLAEAGIVHSVWTTNFDGLVPKAAASLQLDLTVVDVGVDSSARLQRQHRLDELLHVALHGDYRYDALKNTRAELRNQDDELRAGLVKDARDKNLIVVGYSGRDDSVMDALREAYAQEGTGWLYWCGYDAEAPPKPVRQLIDKARQNGREAYYVNASGFDDLAERLASHCLEGQLAERAREKRAEMRRDPSQHLQPFTVQQSRPTGLIKSNAFQVECPSEVLCFEWDLDLEGGGYWSELRDRTRGRSDIVAGFLGTDVLALSTIDGVRDAFRGDPISKVRRRPISDDDLRMQNGVVVSLFTKALTRSIAEVRGLNVYGKNLLWVDESTRKSAYGQTYMVHEAARIHLRRYRQQQYLVISPTIVTHDMSGEEPSRRADKELKRKVLSRQYNSEYNDALDRWRERFDIGGGASFEFPPNSGSMFLFNIRSAPDFAAVSSSKGRAITVPDAAKRLVRVRGIELQEPELLFSRSRGSGHAKDFNPVRGLCQNLPYDYALNRNGLGGDIRVGVICPRQDTQVLSRYLKRFAQKQRAKTKDEYLTDYPGFRGAFGVALDVPEPQNNAWVECPEPDPSLSPERGGTALSQSIMRAVDQLHASPSSPHVIVVYVPRRWASFESFSDENQVFDLHDQVKAFSIERGIATQFLRESTVQDSYQGSIMWSLALAFYVKAMRTPWVLDRMDDDTAFVGLGFSLDHHARAGRQVLMGCSHIYNAEGLGLSYRMSQIESPVIDRRKNPFMSREDARRMAENTLQLYYSSRFRLPQRVVVHKRVHFKREEREGLLEGLSGVDNVDLLEINVEPSLRYVASRVKNGQFRGDGFPVRRGTTLPLDDDKALIWVHGSTSSVKPGRTYYQGKRRIPAPLMVKRHHGKTGLPTLAEEIVGLSKMNWNTIDLYTKLPATLDSSQSIARIGSLAGSLGAQSHDYRLFM